MAYWPAGPTGLYPEAAAPLADFLVRLAQAGRRVARLYYGAEPGAWVAHGFTDAWASAAPLYKVSRWILERERRPFDRGREEA